MRGQRSHIGLCVKLIAWTLVAIRGLEALRTQATRMES
jgi:hypothetical protein